MINTHKLELPLSQTYFRGPKSVRAIEVLLYINKRKFMWFGQVSRSSGLAKTILQAQ